jgi:phospholipid/cholesterol/gamma-HCH transport system substrate-binding protein
MLFGRTILELKVGIFVFIGIIILMTFVLSIGGYKTWTAGYNVHFTFKFVNGVKLGAPVRFAGIDVGEVKEISFNFNPQESQTKVRLICWIKNDIKIPIDSSVWVNTLGLLGEKYIEIMPGKDYSKYLAKNQELIGTDPVPMHEIGELLKNLASDIDESIVKIKNKEGTVGKLLYDDTIYKELEALIIDLRKHPWKLFWKTKEKK